MRGRPVAFMSAWLAAGYVAESKTEHKAFVSDVGREVAVLRQHRLSLGDSALS